MAGLSPSDQTAALRGFYRQIENTIKEGKYKDDIGTIADKPDQKLSEDEKRRLEDIRKTLTGQLKNLERALNRNLDADPDDEAVKLLHKLKDDIVDHLDWANNLITFSNSPIEEGETPITLASASLPVRKVVTTDPTDARPTPLTLMGERPYFRNAAPQLTPAIRAGIVAGSVPSPPKVATAYLKTVPAGPAPKAATFTSKTVDSIGFVLPGERSLFSRPPRVLKITPSIPASIVASTAPSVNVTLPIVADPHLTSAAAAAVPLPDSAPSSSTAPFSPSFPDPSLIPLTPSAPSSSTAPFSPSFPPPPSLPGSPYLRLLGRTGKKISSTAKTAALKTGRTVAAAAVSGSSAVGTSVKNAFNVPPAVPPGPSGDPNFFFRLQLAQTSLESLRIVEAKVQAVPPSAWIPPQNQQEVENYLAAVKGLAGVAVASTMRFMVELPTPPHMIDLIKAIDLAIEAINITVGGIESYLNRNSLKHPIPSTASEIADLEKFTQDLHDYMKDGISPLGSDVVNAVLSKIRSIQDDIHSSFIALTDPEKEFVAAYDATVLRNLAIARNPTVNQDKRNTPPPPTTPISQAVQDAISAAQKLDTRLEGQQPVLGKTIKVVSPKKTGNDSWLRRNEPTVKDLAGGFDKKSTELLKKSALGQSQEVVATLQVRRASQIQSSMPMTFVSDIAGSQLPFFPTVGTDSLLPFLLVANLLLNSSQNGNGNALIMPDQLRHMQAIDSLISLVVLMSEPHRLLADNLELTFGVGNFGYLVEPAGIRIIERVTQVLSEMSKWTSRITGMSSTRASEVDITYVERAMLSINSVVTDYCAISRPRAGGICRENEAFNKSANNNDRAAAILAMANAAIATHGKSVFGNLLMAFSIAVTQVMSNLSYSQIRKAKLDIKGEFIKSEGSAEERIFISMKTIHDMFTGVNHNSITSIIDDAVVKVFLENLDNIVKDLTAIGNTLATSTPLKASDLQFVINDLSIAQKQIRRRYDFNTIPVTAWFEGKRAADPQFLENWINQTPVPPFDQNLIAGIKQLYLDVAFVAINKFKPSLFRGKDQPAKSLPSSQTAEFALQSSGLSNLPPFINKTSLVTALQTATALQNTAGWYDNLGKAINTVYGTQTTRTAVDYNAIAAGFVTATPKTVNEFEQALIQVALPNLVKILNGGVDIPAEKLDMKTFSKDLYTELGAQNLAVSTENLAKAIAAVVPRVPEGIVLDPLSTAKAVAQAVAENARPTISDLNRALMAEVAVAGATRIEPILTARQDDQRSLQERLAAALARVGGTPPAWTGVVLPASTR